MTIEETYQFIRSFSRSGAPVTDLGRIAQLLHKLGDPQDTLQFVHIAGTNGKGSVAEYCTNALKASGYKVGTLTSPYIRRYEDRIRLCGREIPADALCRCCQKTAAVSGDAPYSQFEITMAIALLYFAEEKADIVVLETGIGGLMDSTNIIQPPLCAVITAVSMDHMQILGSTIEEIAAQKAGIIKTGSHVILSDDSKPRALEILRKTAVEKHCPCCIPDFTACEVTECGIAGSRFRYKGLEYSLKMGGMHQIHNALTALEVLEALRQKGFSIPKETAYAGLAETSVPARIQILHRDPLVLLDGGHNADGVGALTDLLGESGIESWIGICGMTNSKDADTAAFQLALVLNKVLCVDGFTETAMPRDTLVNAFVRQHCMAAPSGLSAALPYALKWAKGSHGAVVICGSLYLAGYYLNEERSLPWNS